MSRPVFSFRPNLENPEHKKAWEILQDVPEGQKNRFLVDAILKGQESSCLEETIRRAVREELKGHVVEHSTASAAKEIPNQMLDFLSQMEAGG